MGTSNTAAVLIHGLLARPLIMAPLGRKLRGDFGQVINWGYRSIWSPIETHGDRLAAFFRQLDDDLQIEQIYLVTHSMGGIVTRLALERYQPSKLHRLVMIAPPNAGSRVAKRLSPWLGRICPPLCQLTDDVGSFVCSLPHPNSVEIGVIAAAGDYLVREASTHLACEADHIVLRGLHSSVLWRRETAEQVRRFLLDGRFQRSAKTDQ